MHLVSSKGLHMSCDYQGYEFGAHYLDSVCCDGYLWDADAYEDGMLTNGGDMPCPKCNRAGWMAYYRDEIIECGNEEADRRRGPRFVKYGGYPAVIRQDRHAVRTIKRWLRRGWYQGRKYNAKELCKGAAQ